MPVGLAVKFNFALPSDTLPIICFAGCHYTLYACTTLSSAERDTLSQQFKGQFRLLQLPIDLQLPF